MRVEPFGPFRDMGDILLGLDLMKYMSSYRVRACGNVGIARRFPSGWKTPQRRFPPTAFPQAQDSFSSFFSALGLRRLKRWACPSSQHFPIEG